MKRLLQTVAATAQQSERDSDSPYLTLDEGARHCRFDVTSPSDPVNGFRRWLIRAQIPIARRGRVLLVDRRVLDAFLQQKRWTKRHSA